MRLVVAALPDDVSVASVMVALEDVAVLCQVALMTGLSVERMKVNGQQVMADTCPPVVP